MSVNKNQPSSQGNLSYFLQIALWTITIYLGYQLLTGGFKNDQKEPQPSNVLSDIKSSVTNLDDESVQKNLDTYADLLKKDDKLSSDTYLEQLMDGVVTSAYIKYQAALKKKDIQKMQDAHQILFNYEYDYQNKSCWKLVHKIEDKSGNVVAEYSASDLYKKVTETLKDWNKNNYVWGFIPGWQLINSLVTVTGGIPWFSYGVAALLLAIVVRAVVWPVSQKQLMLSRKMSQLSPLLNELKNKYSGQDLQLKQMQLYKEYGVNPASGCLIALIQLPLFLCIYQCMLRYKIEFTNGTFLWINPAIADSINSAFPSLNHGLIAPSLGHKDVPLIIIHGVLTTLAMFLSPVQDPSNTTQQRMIGVMSGVMMTFFMLTWPIPSAFTLYWIFTSIFSTAQTLRAHRLPAPPLIKKGADGKDVLLSDISGSQVFDKTGVPKKHKPKKKK